LTVTIIYTLIIGYTAKKRSNRGLTNDRSTIFTKPGK